MEEQLSADPVLTRDADEVEIRIAPDGSLLIPWFAPGREDLPFALWEALCADGEPFPVSRVSNPRIYCG